MDKKQKWKVTFKENGDEYTGYLLVTCKAISKKNSNTILADEVEIEIDEDIIDIEQVQEKE